MMTTGEYHKRGLYAVTPGRLDAGELLERAGQALKGGAVWLQYRAKTGPDAGLAGRLGELCRQYDAVFIVNDDPELARAANADGVHLGRDDPGIDMARAILGPDRIIGVSCYNDLDRAAALAAAGSDYLAFGSLFASPTKPHALHCPLDILTTAAGFDRPVVAIGGITLQNAPRAIAAGADLLAVSSDLFTAPDVRAHAAAYTALFNP